ncbi:hypothetical protein [Nostoc sp. CCY0012]|uniref:hypothetical protein n=1 Tax=Nostoc sp. CCY0012 TaxID=1056123 RepID=UPI0039C61165
MTKISKNKKVAIGIAFTISSFLLVTPSYGFNLGNFLGSIFEEVKGELEIIQNLALTEIENTWEGIREDAKLAINNNVGEMGAPDPIKSSNELKRRLAEDLSLPVAKEKANDLERELNRASISAVIGLEGQQETARKIQQTTLTAQEAYTLAEQAQGMDATQNILKVMAGQNAQIVSMLAQQRTDSLTARQDTAQTNLMLNQIAENLSNQRKSDDLQRIGINSMNHELIGLLRLDPSFK